jgi:hypothetical protein
MMAEFIDVGALGIVVLMKADADAELSLLHDLPPGAAEFIIIEMETAVDVEPAMVCASVKPKTMRIQAGKNEERALPQLLDLALSPGKQPPSGACFISMHASGEINEGLAASARAFQIEDLFSRLFGKHTHAESGSFCHGTPALDQGVWVVG